MAFRPTQACSRAFSNPKGSASKKSVLPCEQDRPDVARKRRFWKRYQANIDPTRLVFIDETWAKTNMTRTHGRCRKGERLRARVPHSHWKTLTFLAALRHDRITAPCVLDGPINGRSFLAYELPRVYRRVKLSEDEPYGREEEDITLFA
ncbi:transposase [Komagataeibacter europaeus]|uniref:transposase n=1 Tax=Komagataeibacter europaeus TaxID=33995 RepID=UPI003570A9D2